MPKAMVPSSAPRAGTRAAPYVPVPGDESETDQELRRQIADQARQLERQAEELETMRRWCADAKRRRAAELKRATKAERLLVDTTVETTISALQAKVDAGSPLERPQLFDVQLEALRSAGAAAEAKKEEAEEAEAAAAVERRMAQEAVEDLRAAQLAVVATLARDAAAAQAGALRVETGGPCGVDEPLDGANIRPGRRLVARQRAAELLLLAEDLVSEWVR